MKTEAEIGARQLQARNTKDCWKQPEARKNQGRIFPCSSKGVWHWRYFDFEPLASRNVKE